MCKIRVAMRIRTAARVAKGRPSRATAGINRTRARRSRDRSWVRPDASPPRRFRWPCVHREGADQASDDIASSDAEEVAVDVHLVSALVGERAGRRRCWLTTSWATTPAIGATALSVDLVRPCSPR